MHVLPIIVNHLSSNLFMTLINRDSHQPPKKDIQQSQTLSESWSKAITNIKNFKLEFSERNRLNHPSKSKFGRTKLKKVSINYKRIQISKTPFILAPKTTKNFHRNSLNAKNIQNIHPNNPSKSQSSIRFKLQSLQKVQEL